MANVCLVYPREINLNFFPLGIGYVASYLSKSGHNVSLLDLTEEEMPLLKKIADRKPDIIGISITTTQLALAGKMIDHVKGIMPGVPIVAGGIHPSYFKDKFLRAHGLDYVIYGEGEITMKELCDSLQSGNKDLSRIAGLIYRKGDEIVINPPRLLVTDLDTLPFPARDLVRYEAYLQPPGIIRGVWTNRSANISTSRGCPGRCTYCGVNYLWGKAYRRRTVDNVLEEIDLLVKRYNIDSLYFMDDTFLMNTRWIEEFSGKFVARKYNLKWSCYGRVDTVDERMLKAIKRSGCVQVEYGIESCSEDVLKAIKKSTRVEQMASAVRMTKKEGMRALGSFIFGFPKDTEKDLEETIRAAPRMKIDFITCYFATPYPGSELYEQAVSENRIIERDMSTWYVRNNNIWRVDLDPETLSRYRNKFLSASRFRNTFFLIKNPVFLFKFLLCMITNYDALYKSIRQSVKARCFDDFGYYFYTYVSDKSKGRNIL